jgi:hypothetical protein
MQIPIINGIYAGTAPDFRTSYPRNMVPVPKSTGIAAGYLRPAEGILTDGAGPGIARGGINWNGTLYRVMGHRLVTVSAAGAVTDIGVIPGTDTVTMVYSFDYLAIAANGQLFLCDGATVTPVSDTDLGTVIDVVWVDGYFMTTDGTSLVVTELLDPFAVDPLKYGSSESDPDPVKALLKLRNEVYALNRYTIEVFDNIGGPVFPFQRIDGAVIERGTIGTHCCAVYNSALAFMGSARDEAPAIWLGTYGGMVKISSREIDQILEGYTDAELEAVEFETRAFRGHSHLWVRLPDRTMVYDHAASQEVGSLVWHELSGALVGHSAYRARDAVWCYGQWNVADTSTPAIGKLVDTVSSQWGEIIGWDFNTQIVYNEGGGAIFHEMELVSLTGNVLSGVNPTIWTQYSVDGETWSGERSISAGRVGERAQRLTWRGCGKMQDRRIQRFRGTSDAHIAVARLEARLEALAA